MIADEINVSFFDACEYMGSTPLPAGREVGPLSWFSASARFDIGIAVQQPHPPYKWFSEKYKVESRAWYEWHWYRGIDPDYRRQKYIPLSKSQRSRIIARDGLVCGICGLVVLADDVHIDHIIPRARGGSDADTNLRVAHSLCNLRKGARI